MSRTVAVPPRGVVRASEHGVSGREAAAVSGAGRNGERTRGRRLVRLAAVVLVVTVLCSYCFVWLRVVPDGFALPVQRLLVAATAVVTAIAIPVLRLRIARPIRIHLAIVAVWAAWLVVACVVASTAPGYQPGAALMDLSKYAAAFLVAAVVAIFLSTGLLTARRAADLMILSSAAAIALSIVALILYLFGVRFIDNFVMRSFGDAWGVWPASGVVPRVVGTATEPQQLSVLIVTGVLLAVRRGGIRYQTLGLLGVAVLLLSQSKFALLSVVVVVIWWIVVTGRRLRLSPARWAIVGGAGLVAVVGGTALASLLPTFQDTIRSGLAGGAFTERADNAQILLQAIAGHPWFGIGPAQYGAFRADVLGIPVDNTYYPNNDYLKVLAETGVPGLALLVVTFLFVAWCAVRAVRASDRAHVDDDRAALASAASVGAVLIALNMVIGYELLHVFFWMNCGMLIGLAASAAGGGRKSLAAKVRA